VDDEYWFHARLFHRSCLPLQVIHHLSARPQVTGNVFPLVFLQPVQPNSVTLGPIRATAHGFSAASWKAGELLAAALDNYLGPNFTSFLGSDSPVRLIPTSSTQAPRGSISRSKSDGGYTFRQGGSTSTTGPHFTGRHLHLGVVLQRTQELQCRVRLQAEGRGAAR
jgi:hypothetical protein